MARTDYGAILSTVINGTSQSIRDKQGTSALIAPKDWGREISRMNKSLIDTVSGSLCSFNDGADAPIINLTANVSGTGCNVKNDIQYGGDVNFNQFVQSVNAAAEIYGITRTSANEGKSLTYSGTTTRASDFTCANISATTSNHVIMFELNATLPSGCRISTSNVSGASASINKSESSYTYFGVNIANVTQVNFTVTPQVFDLTQMFGSTKAEEIYAMEQSVAGSGVAYVRNLLYKDYYAYNTGVVTNISAINGDTDDYVIYPISWQTEVGTITSGTMTVNADGTIDVTSGGTTTRLNSTVDIKTLLGTNNVWVDTGDITDLTYCMDMELHYRSGLVKKTISNVAIASFTDGIKGEPLDSLIVGVEAVQASGTPSPSSPLPISGWNGAVINRCGVNLWNERCEQGALDSNGNDSTDSNRIRPIGYISVKPNMTYYCVAPVNLDIYYYDVNKNFISYEYTKNNKAITTPSNAYYLRFRCGASTYPITPSTYNHDISINYPSTDTNYHAFVGNPYAQYFEGLLNGTYGFANLSELSYSLVTQDRWESLSIRDNVLRPSGNNIKANIICNTVDTYSSNEIYSDLTLNGISIAQNGIMYVRNGSTTDTPTGFIIYELATPVTPTITQAQIDTLATAFGLKDKSVIVVFGNTYYGCSLDVTNRVLTVTDKGTLLGSLDWVYMGGGIFHLSERLTDSKQGGNIMCNVYEPTHTSPSSLENCQISNHGAYMNNDIIIRDDSYSDATTFKAGLQTTNAFLVYELATPIEVQLTFDGVLKTLAGNNNIFADCGDIEELVYYSTESGGATDIESVYQRIDTTGINIVPATLYTFTATEDCCLSLLGTCVTDTGSNQGFIYCTLNGTKQGSDVNLTTGYETPFNWDLHLQSGDEVSIVASWIGSHSYCYYNLRLSQAVAT